MKGRKALKIARPKATFDKSSEKYRILGRGMCRGPEWQTGPWPKIGGLRSVDECYERCKKDEGCTAFEISPSESKKKGKFNCILFGHDDVDVADGFSLRDRKCYRMPNRVAKVVKASKSKTKAKAAIKSAIPTNVDLEDLIDLGTGLCRGRNWQKNGWPKDEGVETFEDCHNECRKLDSCTAFDLTPTEIRNKFRCYLFGHGDIMPATATSFASSNCYKMAGRKAIAGASPPKPTRNRQVQNAAAKKKRGQGKAADTADLGHAMIGRGLCRGPNWQIGKWPKDEGIETTESCSKECRKLRGCTGFELTPVPEMRGKFRCILLGHENIEVADSLSLQKSRCYRLVGRHALAQDLSAQESASDYDQHEDDLHVDEGKGYVKLGRGLCRGPDWQDAAGVWPKFEGLETLDDCFKECKKDKGCTAFELTPSSDVKNKFRCVLHGHGDIDLANAKSLLASRCYRMTGRSPQVGPGGGGGARAQAHAELEGGDGYRGLGLGYCRGEGWQDGDWPLNGGLQTVQGCANKCKKTPGCTSFDTSDFNRKAKKFQCWLHGIKEVVPASDIEFASCYEMSAASEATGPGLIKEGDGACRGEGWQDRPGWPKVRGRRTLKQCGEACASANGCTAFDIRKSEAANKFECTIYGHVDVEPASAVPNTACYRVTASFGRSPIRSSGEDMEAERPSSPKKKMAKQKKYKVPEFDEPEVLPEDDIFYEEELLFDPPPKTVRSREHIDRILGITGQPGSSKSQDTMAENTLKELKKLYEASVLPLETAYKYKELSHRHYGDPEIFAKPLIVLMGPWSGGKSTMINYLLGNEFNKNAFKTGKQLTLKSQNRK